MKKTNLKIIKKLFPCLLLSIFSIGIINAQTPNSVGIGTTNPNNSAILHLESSKQGFLMTRLTTAQITSIVTPTIGLIVYNTNDQCYWYKRPTYWARLCNTDSINAASVITNTFNADTAYTNVNYFGNGIGDSIWVHYAQIDTAIINNLTVHTIKADSIYLGGNSITKVITDSIKSLAWLLKGNIGTNPSINFLGTIDNKDLVFRTNNTEKVRVTASGNLGVGITNPTNKVEVVGNTKTTNLQMTSGAVAGNILQSNAVGSGSWTPLAAIVSTLSPSTFNNNAWTILGNSGTSSVINFAGTKDSVDFVVRSNNLENTRFTTTGQILSKSISSLLDFSPTSYTNFKPQFAAKTNSLSGMFISTHNHVGLKNKDNTFLMNDSSGNTFIHQMKAYAFEDPLTVTASRANLIVNNGSFINSHENISFNHNTVSNSVNSIFMSTGKFSGLTNVITGVARCVVIGKQNTVNSSIESILIGDLNNVNGGKSWVFGYGNVVNNQGAVCIGVGQRAMHAGAMALGVSSATTIAVQSVVVGAEGGFRVFSNNLNTSGVALAPGGGAFASVSDRRLKENIKSISNKKILEKLLAIPVTEWTYLSQPVDTMNKYAPDGIHYDKAPIHIGPMAQDFSDAFGYGEFKDKITTSDMDGVLFSGIQALAEENKELKAKLEKLAGEFEELKKLVNELKKP